MLLPLAVINDNLEREQEFQSGWVAFRKGQILLRKLLKYWCIPVFNLPWFIEEKGERTRSLPVLQLLLLLSPTHISKVSLLTCKNTLIPGRAAAPGVSFAPKLTLVERRTRPLQKSTELTPASVAMVQDWTLFQIIPHSKFLLARILLVERVLLGTTTLKWTLQRAGCANAMSSCIINYTNGKKERQYLGMRGLLTK